MDEQNKMLIYTDNNGLTRIDVKLEDDTLWLTQAQMCELYQTSKSNVSEHIMGLFTFRGTHPALAEARTAKNYLDEKELRSMGQLVSEYFDFAERLPLVCSPAGHRPVPCPPPMA